MVGYACESIEVSRLRQWLAQIKGTWNDASASMSWSAGVSIANGAAASETISNLVYTIWDMDEKTRKLWPNDAASDNYRYPFIPDPDTQFCSPDFLFKTNP
jgi:hypothetical protein